MDLPDAAVEADPSSWQSSVGFPFTTSRGHTSAVPAGNTTTPPGGSLAVFRMAGESDRTVKLAVNVVGGGVGGAVTSRLAVLVTPLREAVITAVAVEVTAVVETVNVAEDPETLT